MPDAPLRILVIDDEKNIRSTFSMYLEERGYKVEMASSRAEALAALADSRFDVAFLDLRLGQESGLDVLPELLAASPGLDVVIVTAYATFDTAVEAVKRGAVDYVPKPFSPAQIDHVLERLRKQRNLSRRLGDVEAQLREAVPEADLETASPAMRTAIDTVKRAAAADAPVLLTGENGTGKGVLARYLHSQSPRQGRPFVVVNCPTLSEELLASELFGHARGAFTGAVRDQPGRVEAAEGGTLFLDEIGEMSPTLQAKLLRFLQERQFERLGESRTRHADVRVVAATNRDLDADVRSGRFREDLLYRLNVIEVRLPPLRQRPEDIVRLARGFVSFFARALNRPEPEISPAAEAALLAHSWPGNVRELRNVIERALILSPAAVLEPAAFPVRLAAAAEAGPTLGADFTLDEIERQHIQRVLARHPKAEEAAAVLGIDPSTLWRKRKRWE